MKTFYDYVYDDVSYEAYEEGTLGNDHIPLGDAHCVAAFDTCSSICL